MTDNEGARKKWKELMLSTISMIEGDSENETLSAKDQLLNFYYIHFEVLAEERDLILSRYKNLRCLPLLLFDLREYRRAFEDIMQQITDKAIEEDVVKDLHFLNKAYGKGLWGQLLFLLRFWIFDESDGYEMTDALIEKTVTSTQDVLKDQEFASSVDLWKFVAQQFKFS